jgi:hypothetical protein
VHEAAAAEVHRKNNDDATRKVHLPWGMEKVSGTNSGFGS